MKIPTYLSVKKLIAIPLITLTLAACNDQNIACDPNATPTMTMATDNFEVKENDGNLAVDITLSEASCKNSSIEFINSDDSALGADFSQRSDAVIPAGQTTATIKLDIADDDIKEDREKFTLKITTTNETITNETQPFQVDIIPVISQIFDGYYGMCSLSEDNLAKCWGYNGGYNFAVNHSDDIGDSFGDAEDRSYACHSETQTVLLNHKTYTRGDDSVCTSKGGLGYDSGFDLNGNDLLDDDEITGGYNYCDRAGPRGHTFQVEVEEKGRNCEFGGNAVYFGDAKLDGAELTTSEMGEQLIVSELGDSKILDMGLGEYHSCALFEDKSVKCWGSNSSGKLGLGLPSEDESRYIGDDPSELGNALVAIDFGDGNKVEQLSVGDNHSCVVLENGEVKCWGDNNSGELGYGDTLDRGDSTATSGNNLLAVDLGTDADGKTYTAQQISAGYNSTCALLNDGNVKCWGQNSSGMLGNDDIFKIGDENNEMGNNLAVVNLGLNRGATRVFTGYRESCAVLDNGALKCWGNNNYGQLSQASQETAIGDGGKGRYRTVCHSETEQSLVSIVALSNGENGCDDGGGIVINSGFDLDKDTILQQDEYTSSSTTCDQVGFEAIGQVFAVEVGSASCNEYGGVGYYYGVDANGLFDAEMGDALPEIELGNASGIKDVQLNWYNNCVIFNDNTLKCVGYGETSGLDSQDDWGDDEHETFATAVSPDLGSGINATAIAGRGYQMCALTNTNDVKCWGYSDYGETGYPDHYYEYLGDGEDKDGEPTFEMGDNLPTVEIY